MSLDPRPSRSGAEHAPLPHDPALPGLERLAWRARPGRTFDVIKHRPGRRMVIREHNQASGTTLFWKLWSSDRGVALMLHLRDLHRLGGEGRLAFRVPAAMGYWPEGRLLALAGARGEPVTRLRGRTRIEACAAAGRALASLHDSRWVLDRRWPLAQEAQVLNRACEALERADPVLATRARALVASIVAEWPQEPEPNGAPGSGPAATERPLPPAQAAPAVPLHRDFHPGQILHSPGEPLMVLDWDDAAAGPAVIDVANFAAHLKLEGMRARREAAGWDQAERAFLTAYLEARGLEPWSGMAPFVAATLLRLAGVAVERRGDRREAQALIARAGETLGRSGA